MTKKTLLVIIGCAIIAYFPIRHFLPRELEYAGTYVLFLTLLAILWYSWETNQLKILSLKPHLEIVFQRAYFRLYNIGNGPAVHVRIDDKIVSPGGWPERLRFVCPPIIRKDECLPIEIKILTEPGQEEDTSASLGFIKPPLANFTEEIDVHFENLLGKTYDQKLVIGEHMSINKDPVDFVLQYLYEQYERDQRPIHPNEIYHLYVDPKEVKRHLNYCLKKGLIEVLDESLGLGEDLVQIRIKSEGIDYLKSNE